MEKHGFEICSDEELIEEEEGIEDFGEGFTNEATSPVRFELDSPPPGYEDPTNDYFMKEEGKKFGHGDGVHSSKDLEDWRLDNTEIFSFKMRNKPNRRTLGFADQSEIVFLGTSSENVNNLTAFEEELEKRMKITEEYESLKSESFEPVNEINEKLVSGEENVASNTVVPDDWEENRRDSKNEEPKKVEDGRNNEENSLRESKTCDYFGKDQVVPLKLAENEKLENLNMSPKEENKNLQLDAQKLPKSVVNGSICKEISYSKKDEVKEINENEDIGAKVPIHVESFNKKLHCPQKEDDSDILDELEENYEENEELPKDYSNKLDEHLYFMPKEDAILQFHSPNPSFETSNIDDNFFEPKSERLLKFGVVAPSEIRVPYKRVVLEYKRKFNIPEVAKSDSSSSCDDGEEEEKVDVNQDEFFDSFFNVNKNNHKLIEPEPTGLVTDLENEPLDPRILNEPNEAPKNDNNYKDLGYESITEFRTSTLERVKSNKKKLSHEELKLVDAVKRDRFSRPLSDINIEDLMLVQELSQKYNVANEERKKSDDFQDLPEEADDFDRNRKDFKGFEDVTVDFAEEMDDHFDSKRGKIEDKFELKNVASEDVEKIDQNISCLSENEEGKKSGKTINSENEDSLNYSAEDEYNISARKTSNVEESKPSHMTENLLEAKQDSRNKNDKFEELLKKYAKKDELSSCSDSVTLRTKFFEPFNRKNYNSLPKPFVPRKTEEDRRFKRSSLSDNLPYKPIYANNDFVLTKETRDSLKRRSKNGDNVTPDIDNVPSKNHALKMKNIQENFCETTRSGEETNQNLVMQETSGENVKVIIDEKKLCESGLPTVFGGVERFYDHAGGKSKEKRLEFEESREVLNSAMKKGKKFLETHDDFEDLASGIGTSSNNDFNSVSSIAIAGKYEQLDITQHLSPSVEEINNSENNSNTNLFHLETPSVDKSYLDIFKSKEEQILDDLSKKNKPSFGYFNVAYLGSDSDDSLLENVKMLEVKNNPAKPKIVDFVPLDDESTTEVFSQQEENFADYRMPSHDTLERITTSHVLNNLPGECRKKCQKEECGQQVKKGYQGIFPSKSSTFHVSNANTTLERNVDKEKSRNSFIEAKKIFEDLVQGATAEKRGSSIINVKPSVLKVNHDELTIRKDDEDEQIAD